MIHTAGARGMRCRHHTDRLGLRGIKKDLAINLSRGDPIGIDVEVEPFGPVWPYGRRTPKDQTGATGGGAYVEFDLPEGVVFQRWVGPRHCARVPSEHAFRIDGLRPVFVVVRWWKLWRWWR